MDNKIICIIYYDYCVVVVVVVAVSLYDDDGRAIWRPSVGIFCWPKNEERERERIKKMLLTKLYSE